MRIGADHHSQRNWHGDIGLHLEAVVGNRDGDGDARSGVFGEAWENISLSRAYERWMCLMVGLLTRAAHARMFG